MYVPPAFRDDEVESIRATICSAGLANLVTATADGPIATPLPLFLDETEGEHGVLYRHLAKAIHNGVRLRPAKLWRSSWVRKPT